jgi:hypothetical protein
MSESNTTAILLKEYLAAIKSVEYSERELSVNKSNLVNKRNALGKHLAPKDVQHGEKFSIWVRDENNVEKLLIVEVLEDTYVLSWRK